MENLFSGIPNPSERTPNEKNEPSTNCSCTKTDDLREKLILLAEKGKINYSVKYIQKANRDALEKIKIKYDRKITEKSSKMVSNLLVSKLSDILEKTDLIDSSSELKQELDENELFKEELNELINDELMPYIPKIGLVSGGVTVIEKIIKKRMGKQNEMGKPPDVNLGS